MSFIIEGVDGTYQGKPLKMVVHRTDLNLVTQFCKVFEAMFPAQASEEKYALDILQCGFIEVFAIEFENHRRSSRNNFFRDFTNLWVDH